MKKTIFFLVIASLAALGICAFSTDLSYEERLIRVSVKEALGRNAEEALSESAAIQALFLDYSDSPELILKLRIAILKYGETARSILTAYGSEPEMRNILEKFGENIIPVVDYFVRHDLLSLRIQEDAQRRIETVKGKTKALWERVTGREPVPIPRPITQQAVPVYAPTRRGWQAVVQIQEEGYNFLSQFVIDRDKKARWIQTERLLEGTGSFFASGVRELETRYALDQEIGAADLFWTGVDAVVFVSALKVLRTVKALSYSGRRLGLAERTGLIAGRMMPKGLFTRRVLKYSSAAGIIYVVAGNPELLTSILSEAANALGLNPLLVQFAGWALVIFALMFPLVPLLSALLSIGIRILSTVKGVLQVLGRQMTSSEAKGRLQPGSA